MGRAGILPIELTFNTKLKRDNTGLYTILSGIKQNHQYRGHRHENRTGLHVPTGFHFHSSHDERIIQQPVQI